MTGAARSWVDGRALLAVFGLALVAACSSPPARRAPIVVAAPGSPAQASLGASAPDGTASSTAAPGATSASGTPGATPASGAAEPAAAGGARESTPAGSSAAASAPVATTSPVPAPAPAVVTTLPAATPLPQPPTFSAGVTAHFPEPAVTFATPAFETGREAFTSDEELGAILHGLERSAVVGERGSDIQVQRVGDSQAGRPIEAIVFSRPAAAGADAASATAPGRRPAIVVIAGQHGDEPAASEALVVVATRLAEGRFGNVLASFDVVLVPRANPDGAAAFSRTTSDGTDLNRDHLLLRTQEAQALARVMTAFAPLVVVDLHEYPVGGVFVEKFGGVQRHDVLLQTATVANLPPFIGRAAEEWFRRPLVARLRNAGFSVDWYATTSEDLADRRLAMGSIGPQVGRNASGLRNAISILVETRGGGLVRGDLKRRVQAHVAAVEGVFASALAHVADLVRLRQFVERETASLACRGQLVVEAAPTPSEYTTAVLEPTTGAVRQATVAWDSALELRATKTRARPCGYWLAASETDAVRRLRALGVDVVQLDEGGEVRGETYRETGREAIATASKSGVVAAEPGATTRLHVRTTPTLLEIAPGGYYVSLEQPLANLAAAALEPEAPASFAANGVIESVGSQARILQRPELRTSTVP